MAVEQISLIKEVDMKYLCDTCKKSKFCNGYLVFEPSKRKRIPKGEEYKYNAIAHSERVPAGKKCIEYEKK